MNKELVAKLKTLPNSPGVYFHKNKDDQIIYVGKAANLKNRVRQYFQNISAKDVKTQALVAEVKMTDWITVETEIDALFLESEMIKRYKPQYNILLRDDKSSMFVRVGYNDEFPAVSFTRAPLDDGGEYFGPFYNGSAVKKSMRLLRRVFPYYLDNKMPDRPGLDYQMRLTPGLEATKPGSEEYVHRLVSYKKNLKTLGRYLKGGRKKIQKELKQEMKIAAEAQDFELAAERRNQLRDLSELGRQIIFSKDEFLDISKDHAMIKLVEILGLKNPPKRIEAYDISHISGTNNVASMVVFTNGLADKQEYRKFKMQSPGNDDFLHMREVIKRRFSARNKKWLLPDLIIVDGGKGQLTSAINTLDEAAKTNVDLEQKMPITIGIAKEDEEIIIDKDRSKVSLDWLDNKLGQSLDDISVRKEGQYYILNLHKSQTHSQGHSKNLLGEDNSDFTDLTKLLQRIRDESHRFAINYHSSLRLKSQTKNELESIPGVGPKTRSKLLRKFGSLKRIKEANIIDLEKIVGKSLANKVNTYLNR